MSISIVLDRYKLLFENLTINSIDTDFLDVFDSNVYFKDPFNEVRGLSQIQRIFHHMFASLHEPVFIISHTAGAEETGYLTWYLSFKLKPGEQQKTYCIKGVSEIRINHQQQVIAHIDYWDTGEFIYNKIPLLGGIIRLINQRLSTPLA